MDSLGRHHHPANDGIGRPRQVQMDLGF